MTSFGMMNEAYFVGKNILLDWMNNFLEISLDKVENCATGAVYCQLFDALHPGTIPMSRVDFTVKYEYDYPKNWKLLQNAFQKMKIDKVIPVQRLIKARYQDNLEFLQWMYKYSRDTYNGDPDDPTYDAIGRRSKSRGGKDYTGSSNKNRKPKRGGSRPTSANNKQYKPKRTANTNTGGQRGAALSNNNNKKNQAMNAELDQLKNENQALMQSKDEMQTKMDGMSGELEELTKIAKDIENERDFYFNKVVAIENILKDQKEVDLETSVMKQVFEILYQNDADKGSQNDEMQQ